MQCTLSRAKFFASLVIILHFAICGVVLIWIYFSDETMSEFIFEWVRAESPNRLSIGILHLLLALPAALATWTTAKLFRSYLSDSDPWFAEMWELLKMNDCVGKYPSYFDDEESNYLEPIDFAGSEKASSDVVDKAKTDEGMITYKPSENATEAVPIKEERKRMVTFPKSQLQNLIDALKVDYMGDLRFPPHHVMTTHAIDQDEQLKLMLSKMERMKTKEVISTRSRFAYDAKPEVKHGEKLEKCRYIEMYTQPIVGIDLKALMHSDIPTVIEMLKINQLGFFNVE